MNSWRLVEGSEGSLKTHIARVRGNLTPFLLLRAAYRESFTCVGIINCYSPETLLYPHTLGKSLHTQCILQANHNLFHLLDFFREKNIEFHPDYSWKTFIWLIAKFIVNGREEEIVETDWRKMARGGTAMFIKFSTMAAFDEGAEILRG
ncbi:hypothetical protein L873DRAFT_1814193 [Choiromyces venosus 120613-1]|uniref:Uncharacterized protein n=1 Tax=Choiromyces venosus 120613-1 TaxID=1336337 RepID=A0A3N4J8K6_9PEZI|nr:hypothetical protein L873DRAFT_1814193 [Choiromyces venosus 120613-1]